MDDSNLLVLPWQVSVASRVKHIFKCTYWVFVTELSSEFYRGGRCEFGGKAATNVLRTSTNGATADDDNILRRFKALLPLGDELTDVGVALRESHRTGPFGSSS